LVGVDEGYDRIHGKGWEYERGSVFVWRIVHTSYFISISLLLCLNSPQPQKLLVRQEVEWLSRIRM